MIFAAIFAANTAAAQSTFPAERLGNAIEQYCLNKFSGDYKIDIQKKLDSEYFKMSGVVAKIDHSASNSGNMMIISIAFSYNGRLLKRVKTPVRFIKYIEAPVAARDIRPGQTIRYADFGYDKIESGGNSGVYPAMEDIAGRKAVRGIRQGEAIEESHLEKDILIKHGENVTINVIAGAVRVRTLGSALTDAAEGDIIRVQRNGDRTIIQGRVAPDGSVIISNNKYLSKSE